MSNDLILLLRGLLATTSFIGVVTLLFRIVGLGRSEALYLACLCFTITAYLLSRRALQR